MTALTFDTHAAIRELTDAALVLKAFFGG